MAASALPDRIEAAADRLAARSLDAMYAEPFWQERFGDRGRAFADEDARHHLRYLVEALRAGTDEPLRRYAVWLRSVLVPRGMCTEHLRDNFAHLRRALGELEDAGPAQAYLEAAEDALDYDPGSAAGALQAAAGALRGRALAIEQAGAGERLLARLHVDARWLMAFLVDAVATGAPAVLANHLRWAAEALGRQGIRPELLETELRALETALAERGDRAADEARACLDAARREALP
jgi:hypothetical protein